MYKKIFFLHFIFAWSHISHIFAPAFKDAPTLGEVAQSVRAQDS